MLRDGTTFIFFILKSENKTQFPLRPTNGVETHVKCTNLGGGFDCRFKMSFAVVENHQEEGHLA